LRLDRLARDLYVQLWVEKELLRHNVEVVSIQEPCNGDNAISKAMRSIIGVFASLEREVIRDRLWSGRRKRLEQNRFAGGSVAFGYKLDRRTGKLVIDQKAADVVRLIFKLRRQDGLTYSELAAELNRRNIKAPGGGLWKPGTVHYTYNNKTYLGALKYGETKLGAHEALVVDEP
jgi:site-specific DNA recombinase